MISKYVKYAPKNLESFLLERIKKEKGDGLLRKGTFTNEIVWGLNSYMFSNMNKTKQKNFRKGMFLFGMVRKDAKEYLQTKKRIKLPKQYKQIEYVDSVDESLLDNVTGTDINHAYWRIAYNLGIISERTYIKGLPDEYKSVRLASLSTLGASKKYFKIKKGVLTNQIKEIKGEEELQNLYVLIRYTCYKYMNKVKRILGKDFLCYKTDCIYYIDSKENRKKVKDFFNLHKLSVKQLE
jgi:hypothetical protein